MALLTAWFCFCRRQGEISIDWEMWSDPDPEDLPGMKDLPGTKFSPEMWHRPPEWPQMALMQLTPLDECENESVKDHDDFTEEFRTELWGNSLHLYNYWTVLNSKTWCLNLSQLPGNSPWPSVAPTYAGELPGRQGVSLNHNQWSV